MNRTDRLDKRIQQVGYPSGMKPCHHAGVLVISNAPAINRTTPAILETLTGCAA